MRRIVSRADWSSMLVLFLTGVITTVFPDSARGQEINTNVWVEDFAQLKREISGHYANLEWAIAARRLDLKQLSEGTESRLRQASNDSEARKAIESFLDAFGDGHLTVQWPANNTATTTPAEAVEPQKEPLLLCQRLGYREHRVGWRLAFGELDNFRELTSADSKYFPVGVLQVGRNRSVGVIRIAIFSEYAFPDLCEKAVAEIGLTQDSPCDENCEDRVDRISANLLTAALVRQIEILKKAKVSAVAIDITGNGGGTNWMEPAARVLTATPLRSPRQQFIRHAHWTKQLNERLAVVEADLQHSSPSVRPLLVKARNTLTQAISESRKSCIRDVVWENKRLDCSVIVKSPSLYPQSVLAYSRPGWLPERSSSQFLFYPSRYEYKEAQYSGPLVVLVDFGTWSSAEYFAAMLRDNNAATIIGSPTGGAGCGYTNGGIGTLLKNSRATVRIPDCVRLRKDGSNEVAGITPDVMIPWRSNDNRYQRVKRVSDTLSNLRAAIQVSRPAH